MDSALTTVGLPIALGIIMFGLGLSLTPDDFRRVARHPRAVAVALGCQLVLLPRVCFGLVKLFDLPPLLAVGLMLLAASPGGTTANLFSHLFRGDVALNVTLTAVNSVIAIVTLPLITNLAIAHFDLDDSVSLPFVKVVEVFAIVLVPVAIGMVVLRQGERRGRGAMDRPVRIGVGGDPGGAGARASCSTSARTSPTTSPTWAWWPRRSARSAWSPGTSSRARPACATTRPSPRSMEIGVHNATLAIFVAVEVLDSTEISVPAAVYSIFMFVLRRRLWGTRAQPSAPSQLGHDAAPAA